MPRLRLKTGVQPSAALSSLREIAQRGREIGNPDARIAFNDYRAWVEMAENQLRWLTHDRELVTMLLSRRHFLIQDIGPDARRLWGPLYAERDLQVATLEVLVAELETRLERAKGGEAYVLDSNTLLHFQRPDSIPWTVLLGRPSIRLIVPLRVIEELDAKKYGRSSQLAQRAREVLPWLEGAVISGRGHVHEGTTLEVPIEPLERARPEDADLEILEQCIELRDYGGQAVTLVTGDTAMRLRAHVLSLETLALDEKYRRTLPA